MARNDPQINLRIPQELKDALDAASIENKRSLTSEVVTRLEESIAPNSTKQGSDQEEAQQMRAAQLSIAYAGLTLAKMAAKFLQLELPAAGDTKSFQKLMETLEAGLKAMPYEKSLTPSEAYDEAQEVMASYKSVADELGITRMIEAMKRSSNPTSDASAHSGAAVPFKKKSKSPNSSETAKKI